MKAKLQRTITAITYLMSAKIIKYEILELRELPSFQNISSLTKEKSNSLLTI